MEIIYNFVFTLSKKINLPVILIILTGFLFLILVYLRIRRLINPFKRALSLFRKGNYVKTLVYTDYYLEKNPTDKKALILRADTELQLGMYVEAERDYYQLLFKKVKGDGVDTLDVKKKLLKALYHQDRVYETFILAKEILKLERTSAEALYYLALIYLGQLYFHEADRIFKRLMLNRPQTPEIFFAKCINDAQMKRFEDALASINRAIELKENIIYSLVRSSINYFLENYKEAEKEISKLPNYRDAYKEINQYLFYLKLTAMINYMLRSYDRAGLAFKMAVDQIEKNRSSGPGSAFKNVGGAGKTGEKIEKVKSSYGLYGENGRLRTLNSENGIKRNPVADYERRMEKRLSPAVEEYLKLKEVAIEEGKADLFVKRNVNDPFSLLDIDGLTDRTWIHIGYLFSMVKGKMYGEAKEFLLDLRKDHPEIVGLKRIGDLIDEKIEDEKNNAISLEYIREKSVRLADKKKKRYELWEYIEEWEKRIVKPFELIKVAGFSTKKQLNPVILFKKDTKFTLDF